ncbi:MAG TPA: marine proteobacterial sortase target protein, partial [Nitrospiraceae bacterium]|nr:marine proteobacterial sortase target protein [Nitrospiraceae bacterium]
ESHGQYLSAPALKTDVQMIISGLIVRATVRQQFKNDSAEWAEGIYVFPLPEHAAVDHLSMHIGERIIEGMVKERGEAKQTYENAKSEGKRASLVEQERPNIFTTSVANVGPGDDITIEIQYQQTLHGDQGQFRVRFPMVVGPRYVPGIANAETVRSFDSHGWPKNTNQVLDASRITPPALNPKHGSINPVSLMVDLTPGFPLADLESRYHPIHKQEHDGRYTTTLAGGQVPADRDFELVWQPAEGQAPTAALFSDEKIGKAYALFMVMPPALAAIQDHRIPREVVFIIDTSGSMHGDSIEQAKAALQLAIARLSVEDRFNIIQFNSTMDVLFSEAVPATQKNVATAMQYVSRLIAQGGTVMLPALQRALDGKDHTQLRQVIFLTDGQVGNEDELFKTISARLGDSRLFTVGIGSAPNSYFMRKAAEFGRGTFTSIGKTTEVQDKMEALFRKVEYPALTDITLDLPPDVHAEMFPSRIPDLYLGEPVVVSLKADTLPGHAILHGRFGPTPWHIDLSLSSGQQRDGVSAFWARAKTESLMNEEIQAMDKEALRRSVIDVALQHHLVSRYTSLVAVDVTPARPHDEDVKTHAMKTNLPHGQDYEHIFVLPQTATSGQRQIFIVLLCWAVAFLVFGLRKRRHDT